MEETFTNYMECSGCAEHSGCEFCCHVIKLPHGWKKRDAFIYDIPFFPPVTDDVDPDVYTYIWTCGLVTSNR